MVSCGWPCIMYIWAYMSVTFSIVVAAGNPMESWSCCPSNTWTREWGWRGSPQSSRARWATTTQTSLCPTSMPFKRFRGKSYMYVRMLCMFVWSDYCSYGGGYSRKTACVYWYVRIRILQWFELFERARAWLGVACHTDVVCNCSN